MTSNSKALPAASRFAALVTLLFAVGSCGSPPISEQQPAEPQPSAPVPASPLDVTDHLLSSLQKLVEDEMVAGAVGMVAHRGEIVFRGAAGYADREAETAMTDLHLFRIASMTKAVTSVSAMILVERGELGLDDPVSQYLPEFANLTVLSEVDEGEAIESPANSIMTIRHLLTHTSGLSYRFIARGALLERIEKADISDGLASTDYDLAEGVTRLANTPLSNEPGERWVYGMSTDVLGRVVEVVSGKGLDAFFQEHILTPLEMNDTQFFLAPEQVGRLAIVYRPDGAGGLSRISGTVEDGSTIFSVDASYDGPRKYFSGGAGLISTAPDYLRFARMLLNHGELDGERVLKAETVDLMTQNQIGDLTVGLSENKFGLGFEIASRDAGEVPEGIRRWGGFYGSEFWIDYDRQLVGVFMSQVYDLPRRSEIVGRFGQAMFEAFPKPTDTNTDARS